MKRARVAGPSNAEIAFVLFALRGAVRGLLIFLAHLACHGAEGFRAVADRDRLIARRRAVVGVTLPAALDRQKIGIGRANANENVLDLIAVLIEEEKVGQSRRLAEKQHMRLVAHGDVGDARIADDDLRDFLFESVRSDLIHRHPDLFCRRRGGADGCSEGKNEKAHDESFLIAEAQFLIAMSQERLKSGARAALRNAENCIFYRVLKAFGK